MRIAQWLLQLCLKSFRFAKPVSCRILPKANVDRSYMNFGKRISNQQQLGRSGPAFGGVSQRRGWRCADNGKLRHSQSVDNLIFLLRISGRGLADQVNGPTQQCSLLALEYYFVVRRTSVEVQYYTSCGPQASSQRPSRHLRTRTLTTSPRLSRLVETKIWNRYGSLEQSPWR